MKVVVLLSGGLDSTVLLWQLLRDGYDCTCLSFDYGQRHRRELAAAAAVAVEAGVVHNVLALPAGVLSGSALTGGGPVPHGHYADESMKATVVPARNLLLLAAAASAAVQQGAEAVAYAAHAGDHAVYPDCRPEFIEAVRGVFRLCDYRPLELLTPFALWTKAEVARLGRDLRAPLRLTYSCYEGGDRHCGKCGTCHERREAFDLAGVPDPTEYAT